MVNQRLKVHAVVSVSSEHPERCDTRCNWIERHREIIGRYTCRLFDADLAKSDTGLCGRCEECMTGTIGESKER